MNAIRLKGAVIMEEQGNFFVGLVWGTSLSIPLWIAFLGWFKLMLNLVSG